MGQVREKKKYLLEARRILKLTTAVLTDVDKFTGRSDNQKLLNRIANLSQKL